EENIFYTVAPPNFSLWAITGAAELPVERFQESSLQVTPATAEVGQQITVQVFVTNLTDEDAEYNAVLWVDSDVESSQNVIIPAKTTGTVVFTTTLEVGDHGIRIGKQLGSVTITPAATAPAPTATPVPAATAVPAATPVPQATPLPAATPVPPAVTPTVAEDDDDNNRLLIIIGIVVGAVVVLAIGIDVMRRRRRFG
ncbi:MAG: hypothetical protein IID45_11870, partial [Planctomycetes bacterium]|nr:hypothetical protein [Planctomycetota bacterium]